MSTLQQDWPEPVVRVQSLSNSDISKVPNRYVKPMSDRPSVGSSFPDGVNIPIIDL
ncbi:hypothetical protein CRG98_040022, partial [Punica granatum]